eukprot:CAMPEP_0117587540 /NCGR_PEP_ID=MMETSP0784-20121206/69363_1 /TAXON_ID=39447 /ORGANISM="" /LENGTH=300 /DNA_ID=CAMNT_0005388821 /DNA_START=306 /DNA_END=1208 /DNA_ORIENTATION=-
MMQTTLSHCGHNAATLNKSKKKCCNKAWPYVRSDQRRDAANVVHFQAYRKSQSRGRPENDEVGVAKDVGASTLLGEVPGHQWHHESLRPVCSHPVGQRRQCEQHLRASPAVTPTAEGHGPRDVSIDQAILATHVALVDDDAIRAEVKDHAQHADARIGTASHSPSKTSNHSSPRVNTRMASSALLAPRASDRPAMGPLCAVTAASFPSRKIDSPDAIAASEAHRVRLPMAIVLRKVQESLPVSRPPRWHAPDGPAGVLGEILVELLPAETAKPHRKCGLDSATAGECRPNLLDFARAHGA